MAMSGNKEQVRDWMRQRSRDRSPLPEIAEIQREIGWRSSVKPGPADTESLNVHHRHAMRKS